jgi:glycosyltransferase involved in cell wall biosynthesis
VIHLGVDRSIFKAIPGDLLETTLNKYNVSKKYLLTVGTLEPRKNLLKVIEAFSLLENKDEFQMVIIGNSGWGNLNLSSIIKQYNIDSEVIITGYIDKDELNAFYSGAEVFVFPSLYEGFGLPILEAMSCGCPVITSNSSSMPEVANNAAILVDSGDGSEIKNALYSVLNNPDLRKTLRNKGFENVDKFSWENASRQAVSLFEKTVGTR